MNVLPAAVVVLALLVGINLLLTLGLARRIADLTRAYNARARPNPIGGLQAGDEAPPFEVLAVNGRPVSSHELFTQTTVLGFYSTSCSSCRQELPKFAQFGERAKAHKVATYPVFTGKPDDVTAMLKASSVSRASALLAPRDTSTMMDEYKVEMYPSYTIINSDALVEGSLVTMQELYDWLADYRATSGRNSRST